jgi:hypothetical protein
MAKEEKLSEVRPSSDRLGCKTKKSSQKNLEIVTIANTEKAVNITAKGGK